MSYRSAKTSRHELLVAAAVVAAHASRAGSSFRLRDVRFLFDLFANWIVIFPEQATVEIQNTQLLRYLRVLVEQGFARKVGRTAPPSYRLTRTGLIELISRIVSSPSIQNPEHFLFANFFVTSYRSKIEQLIKSEGALFPYSLKVEIEALMDAAELIRRERLRVKKVLERLDRRIDDTLKAAVLIESGLRQGLNFGDLVSEVETRYPYELNSQKPLSELVELIPADTRQWELTSGGKIRSEAIWAPMREVIKTYLRVLENLKPG